VRASVWVVMKPIFPHSKVCSVVEDLFQSPPVEEKTKAKTRAKTNEETKD